MELKQLEVDFFRNYPHGQIDCAPGVNVFYGDNGQGKTNLLEAIYYLSCGKSHRARYDRELLLFGVEHGFIKAQVDARERSFTLEARLAATSRRQLFSNGVKLKTAGELSQVLQTVLFCPEDLQLVRDGAALRRRFLDDCICQLRPRYEESLGEYKRLYDHKTRILRDSEEKPSLLDTLEDFNLRMAQLGALLIHYRAHFVKKLAALAPPIHSDFSGGREQLTLTYQTVTEVSDPLGGSRAILPQLLAQQERLDGAERAARTCLAGPHKDDLNILLGQVAARSYASQGQTRTAALALKLAARELFYEDTGQWPVLLLDDVLSELDRGRQELVLSRVKGGQVFITCCDKTEFTPNTRSFFIANGTVAPGREG